MPEITDADVVLATATAVDALADPEFVKAGEMTAALADKAQAGTYNHLTLPTIYSMYNTHAIVT